MKYNWNKDINPALVKLGWSNKIILDLLSTLAKTVGPNKKEYSWDELNKALMKMNTSTKWIAALLAALPRNKKESKLTQDPKAMLQEGIGLKC